MRVYFYAKDDSYKERVLDTLACYNPRVEEIIDTDVWIDVDADVEESLARFKLVWASTHKDKAHLHVEAANVTCICIIPYVDSPVSVLRFRCALCGAQIERWDEYEFGHENTCPLIAHSHTMVVKTQRENVKMYTRVEAVYTNKSELQILQDAGGKVFPAINNIVEVEVADIDAF